ncbi:uncharacterized protein PITG_21002 [Phytophthora infestans T30-4]|uniref:Uncharacterized protein n=1 Tax=Phytophthora infestans (strain T30-4) TaxID=403677 RepID=D0P2R7_PHYIT|nr:uncharacterized protein PITG_21002 [Phytophthora infestans T30-4]EEY56733.1 hypothetical protein PITG_21002 [Phytophthora infestans T30-4]|eukprot:XP_002895405.1 hypothetical protein PITG_21002 [Phytophthora infestans T30-4]
MIRPVSNLQMQRQLQSPSKPLKSTTTSSKSPIKKHLQNASIEQPSSPLHEPQKGKLRGSVLRAGLNLLDQDVNGTRWKPTKSSQRAAGPTLVRSPTYSGGTVQALRGPPSGKVAIGPATTLGRRIST